MEQGDVIVLNNYYSTGANRVMQLINLRNLRNNDVGAGTRNNLCFAVYNSLRMAYDHEEAMDRLRAYNNGFKKPMTEAELQHRGVANRHSLVVHMKQNTEPSAWTMTAAPP